MTCGMRLPFISLCLGMLLCTALLDFVRRSAVFADAADHPETTIVFTGQFDRVYHGLDLLAAGHTRQLFISGINPGAGIRVQGFAKQFGLTPPLITALEDGRIILATGAGTTVENAVETACWLHQQPEIDTVALVTSPQHMARASVALDRALWGVKVMRVPSHQPVRGLRPDRRELVKFIATWFVTLLPRPLWPVDESRLCKAI